MKKNTDIGLLIIRIATGFTMLFYGVDKLINGTDFIKNLLGDKNLPTMLSYGVYIGEIVAPILIIIGFRTRLVGLIFFVNCLTAILLSEIPNIFKINEYGGWALDLIVIYLLTGVALFFTGAGKIALSNRQKWD